MSNDDELFNQCVIDVQKLDKKPSTRELLELYGLYKQSLFGSNKEQKPSFFNFKDKAKYEAWDSVKTLSKSKAKKQYIELVDNLKKIYGFKSLNK